MAVAKRNLRSGEVLDGEGGYTVYGRVAPARRSLELDALPIGLAHGCTLKANVTKDRPLRWSDVEIETQSTAVRARRAAEALLQDA